MATSSSIAMLGTEMIIEHHLLPAEQWNKSMRYLFEVYLFVWNYDIPYLIVLFLSPPSPAKNYTCN